MNSVIVRLHIVPAGVDPAKLTDFDKFRDGRVLSTGNEMKVNKIPEGYSIIYSEDVFNKMDRSILVSNMIRIFNTNLPGTALVTSITYHYDTDEYDEFDSNTAESVIKLHDFITNIVKTGTIDTLIYEITESVKKTYLDYKEAMESADDDNDDYEYNQYSDDEDVDDADYDLFESLGMINTKPSKKKKKSNDYYGVSRVWKNAKSPKKMVHRHGVLVAAEKNDIHRDEKIIKAFLKDFLPGKANWQKEFREEVLSRWVSMYAVSKKKLKRLEKDHRRRYEKKAKSIVDTDKALDFTRRLFNVPIDRWNDPTK